MSNPVKDYYNQDPKLEWNRLFLSPYRQVEFEVVLHFLSQFLPSEGHVLDLGGGPGRYSVELAIRGYEVSLVDLAEEHIKLANQKFQGKGVSHKIKQCIAGDALDLSRFEDQTFDAGLCMGPLYHFPMFHERLQCLRECHRVLKPGAPLFAMVIPRCTYIRDALRSDEFGDLGKKGLAVLEEIFHQGTSSASQIPNTYFCYPHEVEDWFQQTGFEIVQFASTHGFAAFMDEKINRIASNAETWNGLIKLIIATSTDPGSFTAAEHLLCIGRKRTLK